MSASTKIIQAAAGGAEPEGWDISSASYLQRFSISAQNGSPQAVFFKPDGLKMYTTGTAGSDDEVNEYDLSTAWDISSASFLQRFSTSSQTGNPNGLFFKPDGSRMYVVGNAEDDVFEYSLSTAWDISSASYVRFESIAAQIDDPYGIYFRSDGLKMYVAGNESGVESGVYEYNLSTAWNVSTSSFVRLFDVSAKETFNVGVFFKPDGLKMYVMGLVSRSVHEYDLSSAWNISTASFVQSFSVASQDTNPRGPFFRSDGLKMYIVGTQGDDINEYDLDPV